MLNSRIETCWAYILRSTYRIRPTVISSNKSYWYDWIVNTHECDYIELFRTVRIHFTCTRFIYHCYYCVQHIHLTQAAWSNQSFRSPRVLARNTAPVWCYSNVISTMQYSIMYTDRNSILVISRTLCTRLFLIFSRSGYFYCYLSVFFFFFIHFNFPPIFRILFSQKTILLKNHMHNIYPLLFMCIYVRPVMDNCIESYKSRIMSCVIIHRIC